MPSAYLDHAASTPMRPEAVAAMVEVLERVPGNPSGQHRWARDARRLLDDARDAVAEVVGAEPGEIVFTSGGTEADNLAIAGVVGAVGGVPACSAAEHHAVLDPVLALGGTTVPVDARGHVDLDGLAAALAADRSISLVSVMLANNEVGTVTDLAAVGAVVEAARPHHPTGIVLHTDAVAAAAWTDVVAAARDADLVSVSGHKVGGPKGIGVLVVRNGTRLEPILRGGGQERERRSGTQNLAGAVGLAAALRVAAADRDERIERVGAMRDRLVDRIISSSPDVRETVGAAGRIANIAHLSCHGIESEPLLFLLDQGGVAASAGSSCASGALEPSHVALAMGVDPEWIHGTVRLSLGWSTTEAELDHAVEVITTALAQLRTAPSPAGAVR